MILMPLLLRVQHSSWCQRQCICIFLMDMQQSFIKVGLFCSGRVDVTELSLENDGVWQQQANGCRRSSQSAKPLVMMWWWMRTAGVCRQALHPSQARTKHKAYRRWNVSSILVDEGCGFTKQDAIPIHSVLTLHCNFSFFLFFSFFGGGMGMFVLLCIFVSSFLWLAFRHINHATHVEINS